MWVVKLKLKDENCIWSTRTKKWDVIDYQYPLRYREEKGHIVTVSYHLVEGSKTNIEGYLKDVKQDKRVIKIEKNENVFFSLVREERKKEEYEVFKMIYDPSFIWISPIVNTQKGYEVWNIASFFRKDLSQLIKKLEDHYCIELLEFKKMKVKYLYNLNILPNLSPRQKEILLLAIDKGYYDYPRRVTLDRLSKYAQISKSTLEEHLRKAENKILKFFVESKYF